MRIAICISGHVRTYELTYPFFKANILDVLKSRGQVDCFVSTWNTNNTNFCRAAEVKDATEIDISVSSLDKIISFYQGVVLGSTANKISRQFMLLLLTVALVATGCMSRVRGRMIAYDPPHHKKGKHKTTQAALPPTEKK